LLVISIHFTFRYHRILKRQKRKQLIKEFDELLVRDPEAAKEKLKELENQRIIERGSLKHRARTKFQQDVVKYAGRDSKAKQVLEEHFRLGKELKSKVPMESSSDEEEEEEQEKKMSVSEMIKSAAVAAAKSDGTSGGPDDEDAAGEARVALFELRAKKRRELEAARSRAAKKPTDSEPIFEQESDWTFVSTSSKAQPESADGENESESKADLAETQKPTDPSEGW
ncbi:hypothetical protein OESDEN_17662, partial [Oesophagostomum dentatum]